MTSGRPGRKSTRATGSRGRRGTPGRARGATRRRASRRPAGSSGSPRRRAARTPRRRSPRDTPSCAREGARRRQDAVPAAQPARRGSRRAGSPRAAGGAARGRRGRASTSSSTTELVLVLAIEPDLIRGPVLPEDARHAPALRAPGAPDMDSLLILDDRHLAAGHPRRTSPTPSARTAATASAGAARPASVTAVQRARRPGSATESPGTPSRRRRRSSPTRRPRTPAARGEIDEGLLATVRDDAPARGSTRSTSASSTATC